MQNECRAVPTQMLLVGNPRSRRVEQFRDAARRAGTIDLTIVPYTELVNDRRGSLPRPGACVRLESPGECSDTARLILRAGIEPLESLGGAPLCSAQIDRLPMARGEVPPTRQWYLGYRRILRWIDERFSPRKVRWMSSPADVATTFDKLACLDLWSSAGLPTPKRFPGIGAYDELRRAVTTPHARIFVKLRYGYSALGAVALEWRGTLVRAITTVEVEWSQGLPRLFVTKKPRVLRDERDVAWLIDTLGREQLVVESWLPKARWRGRPFDLRVVTIAGRPWHVVGRANSGPFTNLNLDAERIDREEVLVTLGAAWHDVEDLAKQAASAFPDAHALGIDVLVHACGHRFSLLEANAFGDYLPRLSMDCMSTYEAELRTFLAVEEAAA